MSTIINNPGDNKGDNGSNTSGGAGVVIGALIVILILVVVILFSLPYIRQQINSMTHPGNPTINVQIPALPTTPTASTTK